MNDFKFEVGDEVSYIHHSSQHGHVSQRGKIRGNWGDRYYVDDSKLLFWPRELTLLYRPPKLEFKVGDKVEIIEGTFEGYGGTITSIDDCIGVRVRESDFGTVSCYPSELKKIEDKPEFKVGDRVEILAGAYKGEEGTITVVNDCIIYVGAGGYTSIPCLSHQLKKIEEKQMTTTQQKIEIIEKELQGLKKQLEDEKKPKKAWPDTWEEALMLSSYWGITIRKGKTVRRSILSGSHTYNADFAWTLSDRNYYWRNDGLSVDRDMDHDSYSIHRFGTAKKLYLWLAEGEYN